MITRALCRTTLSRYARVRPEEWRFLHNAHGRPEISEPSLGGRLRFNLSATRGLFACAVTSELDAGIDVEDAGAAIRDYGALADRFFSPLEARALAGLDPARRRARFLEYWTLKESYIKARGRGLSIPLDGFSFHLDEGPRIRVSFVAPFDDEASRWQFSLMRPTSRHLLALGVRRLDDAEVRITLREAVPLRPTSTRSPG